MGFENGKLVRVTLKASAPPKFLQVNTFHYDLDDSGGGNPNDPQALADYFRDHVVNPWRGLYNSAWALDPVLVVEEKDPQNPNAARKEWTSGSGTFGFKVGSGDALAFAHCGVATLKTEHVGRRHTGRTFLGGTLFESEVIGNQWQTGATDLWQSFMDAIPHQPDIASGVSSAVANWCVYSRTNRAQDVDPYASRIVSVVVNKKLHWLRSRDD